MSGAGEPLEERLFEFKLNGFFVIRGLVPTDLVDEMNRQLLELLSLEIEMAGRGDPLSGRGPNRYALNIGALVEKSGGPLNDSRARRNPLIESFVTRVLGPWRFGKLIVETPCRDSDYMGWHADSSMPTEEQQAAPKRTTIMKLHIPLVDVSERNGPMEVIPGSHRMHYVEGDAAVRAVDDLYATRVLLRRGDALLRDGDLIHRGTPNLTDAPRPLYSVIYKALA